MKMSTSPTNQCCICLRVFNQPKLIDCHHSFCLGCLEDYVSKFTKNGSFPCPLCRKNIKVPFGGVQEFSTNFYVAEKATNYKVSCPNHDEAKSVEFYCNQCNVAVCSKCFTTMHNGHRFLDLESEGIKNDIYKNQCELKKQLESCLVKYTDHFEELKHRYIRMSLTTQTATQKVDKKVESICEIVRSFGESLKETIKSVEEKEKDKMNKANEEVQKNKQEIKKFIVLLSKAPCDDSIIDVLETFPRIRELITNDVNVKLYVPQIVYPMFKVCDDSVQITKDLIGVFDVSRDITFTSEFSYDTLKLETQKICASDNHHLDKLSFCLAARNRKDKLGLYLNLNESEHSKKLKYCTVLFSIKLISHLNIEKSKMLRQEYTFTSGGQSWGWSFIDWDKFIDDSNGFIDQDNHIHVEARLSYTDLKWNEHNL